MTSCDILLENDEPQSLHQEGTLFLHPHRTSQQMDMSSSFLYTDKHSMLLQWPGVQILVLLLSTIQEYGYQCGRFSWYTGQIPLDHLYMVDSQLSQHHFLHQYCQDDFFSVIVKVYFLYRTVVALCGWGGGGYRGVSHKSAGVQSSVTSVNKKHITSTNNNYLNIQYSPFSIHIHHGQLFI